MVNVLIQLDLELLKEIVQLIDQKKLGTVNLLMAEKRLTVANKSVPMVEQNGARKS